MNSTGGPPWVNEPAELQQYIVESHRIATNIPQTGSGGEGVHIAVIDSARSLPPDHIGEVTVHQGDQNSFIQADIDDTIGHCIHVFGRLKAYAPRAEYSIYQAVNEDGKLTLGAYADSISKAIDDGVDIVNLSAGDPWRGPIDINPNVQETKRLLERGIPVVAAAGNYYPDKQESRPPVYCPSALDDVISVGGSETRCPNDDSIDNTERSGPYFWNPDPDDLAGLSPVEGRFCGERGCVHGENCITNQIEEPWEHNPLPTGDKPDILAPMHVVDDYNESTYINAGTSFAAPLVTASLACIISEIRQLGDPVPPPYRLRGIVRTSGMSVRDSQASLYDAMGVRDALGITR